MLGFWLKALRRPTLDLTLATAPGLTTRIIERPGVVAFGTRLVPGPLFPPLRWPGLAATLVSERGTFANSAIALFHRPAGEDPLVTGRAFYRAWLAMTAQRLAACRSRSWPTGRRAIGSLSSDTAFPKVAAWAMSSGSARLRQRIHPCEPGCRWRS